MGIKIGTNNIDDLKVGSSQVSKVMLNGKNLVDLTSTTTIQSSTLIDGNSITVTSSSEALVARAVIPLTYALNTPLTLSYDAEVLINNSSLTSATVYLRSGSTSTLVTSFPLTPNTTSHKSITLNEGLDSSGYELWLYIKVNTREGVVSVKFSNIQLEYSESETSYQPYIGEVTLWEKV